MVCNNTSIFSSIFITWNLASRSESGHVYFVLTNCCRIEIKFRFKTISTPNRMIIIIYLFFLQFLSVLLKELFLQKKSSSQLESQTQRYKIRGFKKT